MVELFPGIINSFLKSGYCFENAFIKAWNRNAAALQAFSLFPPYVLTGYLQLREQNNVCFAGMMDSELSEPTS